MKTTIDLPDDLLIEAKTCAAELRRSLRSIFESALRAELAALKAGGRPEERRFRWVTAEGGLPPSVDLSDRASTGDWMLRERAPK